MVQASTIAMIKIAASELFGEKYTIVPFLELGNIAKLQEWDWEWDCNPRQPNSMRGTGERILSLCSAAPKCSPKRALRSPKMRKRMQGRRRSTKRPPTFLILTTRWRQRQTLKPRTIFIFEVKVLKRLEGQTSQRKIITKDIDPSHCFCSRKDCS